MKHLARVRTLVAVAAILVVTGAATAVAGGLITGADVKDGSLTGVDIKDGSLGHAEIKNESLTDVDVKDNSLISADIKDGTLTGTDVKNGSLGKGELTTDVQNLLKAIPIRVTGALPKMGFSASNTSVKNTSDGVKFGPYPDGGAAGGSVCTDALTGQPLSDVSHLAFEARYTADGDTGGVGVPYLRIFLNSDADDAIFSPNTQPPDPDVGEGPFHTWVGTAGLWRYDDDSGSGGQYGPNGAPFSKVKTDHGTETISKICISTGFTAGTNLSALLRTWEVNSTDYAFGL